MFYNTNGIPTESPIEGKYWIQQFEYNYILKENDITYEIEAECQILYELISIKLFGNVATYYSKLPTIPLWIMEAGLDAEFKISRLEFEKIVAQNKSNQEYCKMLYLYDFRNLIASIQNSIIESKYLLGQFFKQLNENDFLIIKNPINENGLQNASGLIVTEIFSTLNHLFICLYSILDFTTKLFFEFENTVSEFSVYPRLKSLNKTYGDHKRLISFDKTNTIFEHSETLDTIITIRNEIVHNSTIDNLPKVYQSFQDGKLIEKYILLPDFENGKLISFVNRKRFFDNDTKVNEILPDMIKEFWTRILMSIKSLKNSYLNKP